MSVSVREREERERETERDEEREREREKERIFVFPVQHEQRSILSFSNKERKHFGVTSLFISLSLSLSLHISLHISLCLSQYHAYRNILFILQNNMQYKVL